MAKFQNGDTIIYVVSMEKGVVIEVYPLMRGRQLYRVRIGDEDKNCLESNLTPDTDLSDPFIKLKRGIYGTYLDFSRINTSFKIKNTSNNTISTLKASNTIFKAYQFKPLLKFLNSDNRRLLVADEVGLGKTIEAGHIMLELMARNELKNAIIICPKSLQIKWQKELESKFNFRFKIYDDKKDFLNDLKSQGHVIKCIINYEKISLSTDFLNIIESNNILFDFVLFDEAHRLRNHTTNAYKSSKKILDLANSAVMLTATPIMIREENLFNLLKLLDDQKYREYSTFKNELNINRPFIKALNQINRNIPFYDILQDLEKATVSLNYNPDENYNYEESHYLKDLFVNVPLFEKIINQLKEGEDNSKSRVQLQFDISYLSEMNKIFSRTRKVEVTQDWSQAVREPHTHIIELYPDERAEFDNIIDNYIDDNSYVDDYGEERMYRGKQLGLVSKKRQVASSVYGYLNSSEDISNRIDRFCNFKDRKLDELLSIIKHLKGKKLIVFAVYVDTLKYLDIRLNSMGIRTLLIHGQIKERDTIIDKFRDESDVKVLLSSEVGSEGLDLQFCDTIVNYDLPWNPMVVEQRIGRIDRFGQKSSIVHIFNLVIKDSIQEDIYTRLLDRIGIFKESIGDLEAILDKDLERQNISGIHKIRDWFSKLENELYRTELTKEQRQNKIDAIAKAIITEQKNLEDVSEGLTNTLTNDIYFRNEIENIRKSYRYVTEKELVNYLRLLFKKKEGLKTCELIEINEKPYSYKLNIPDNAIRLVKSFLTEHMPDKTESVLSFKKFINHISENYSVELTFSQEEGYANHKIQRINAYHPLIVAAMSYFDLSDKLSYNTFSFSVNSSHVDHLCVINPGMYFMAVYSSSYIKKIFRKEQKIETLIPIIYDLERDSIIKDRLISDEFFGIAQLFAKPSIDRVDIDNNVIDTIKCLFTESIDEIEQINFENQKILLDSHMQMQRSRKSEYYGYRIEQQKNIVTNTEYKILISTIEIERRNYESILPAQRKVLQNLIDEKNSILNEIDSFEIIRKSPKLLSLSCLKLY